MKFSSVYSPTFCRSSRVRAGLSCPPDECPRDTGCVPCGDVFRDLTVSRGVTISREVTISRDVTVSRLGEEKLGLGVTVGLEAAFWKLLSGTDGGLEEIRNGL